MKDKKVEFGAELNQLLDARVNITYHRHEEILNELAHDTRAACNSALARKKAQRVFEKTFKAFTKKWAPRSKP